MGSEGVPHYSLESKPSPLRIRFASLKHSCVARRNEILATVIRCRQLGSGQVWPVRQTWGVQGMFAKILICIGLLCSQTYALGLDEIWCRDHHFEYPCFGGPGRPDWAHDPAEVPEVWETDGARPPICSRALIRCRGLLDPVARQVCAFRVSVFQESPNDPRCGPIAGATLPSCASLGDALAATAIQIADAKATVMATQQRLSAEVSAVQAAKADYAAAKVIADSECPPYRTNACMTASRKVEAVQRDISLKQLAAQRTERFLRDNQREEASWGQTASILEQADLKKECR